MLSGYFDFATTNNVENWLRFYGERVLKTHPGSPGWPQQLFSLVILMSKFLISRPIFLHIGKVCLRLSMAVFIFGCFAAHMILPFTLIL